MWINSILEETYKCYIPNILLLRIPCRHTAAGSPELCTHNHRFTRMRIHTDIQPKEHIQTHEWCTHKHKSGHVGLSPFCLTFLLYVLERAAGHYGWQWVDAGQNHKFGVSRGQTGKIYDWSGSTSAAWCCGFRMPGMGVRSDSNFSLCTLSGNCSQCDQLKMAVLLVIGTQTLVVWSFIFSCCCIDLDSSEHADLTQ